MAHLVRHNGTVSSIGDTMSSIVDMSSTGDIGMNLAPRGPVCASPVPQGTRLLSNFVAWFLL